MTLKELVRNSLRAKINGQEPDDFMLNDCLDYVSENTPDVTETTAENINDCITDYVHDALIRCENCKKWVVADDYTVHETHWHYYNGDGFYCSEECRDEDFAQMEAQLDTERSARTY